MIKKDVHYNKKSILDKAQEMERRAKNLDKLYGDFKGAEFSKTRAELYETAGEHYLNAKKPRKAISCYEKAAESWDYLNSVTGVTDLQIRKGVKVDGNSPAVKLQREYGNNRNKDLKNAERIKKTIKGTWKGLEGKTISAIFGIGGILSSGILFSGKITGNVIGNSTSQTSNIFGGILFLIGITGCLFYFKNRK